MDCNGINKVILQGQVGFVRKKELTDTSVFSFGFATQRLYVDKAGCNVVETSWHNCEAWADKVESTELIVKGAFLRLEGRIRYSKFTGSDNVERTCTDIVIEHVELAKES